MRSADDIRPRWTKGVIERQLVPRPAQRLSVGLWSLLDRPWGVRHVVVVLAIMLLLDLALGHVKMPGSVGARGLRDGERAPKPPRPIEAVLDESAHAMTALVLFKAAGVDGAALALPLLVGAVLIDVDHVPMEVGLDVVTRGTNRPYSHSVVVVGGLLILAGLSGASRSRMFLAVAFGVGTHLLRDMATGGVPLYWPLFASRVTIDYGVYAAVMLVGGAMAVRSGRRR
jgi:inner membrane protein